MTEYRLFAGDVAAVSTADFHADRDRAPHLEQDPHRWRLAMASSFAWEAQERLGHQATVSDLGCGDGGLLSLLALSSHSFGRTWGYDFCPANAAGWDERGVTASALDVFGDDWEAVQLGNIVVMTEVLEHLTDPHGVLRRLRAARVRDVAQFLVCSSPWTETDQSHCGEHAWAWDDAGYVKLLTDAGWTVQRHAKDNMFQVVLAS